jgi:hypothetical protein
MAATAVALAAIAAPAEAAPRATLTPAAGPAGATAVVTGAGFGARARVAVTVAGGQPVRARAGRRGVFRANVAIPAGAAGRVSVRSRTRGRRGVRNVFVVGGASGAAEVASATGPRVRWRVAGGKLRLSGSGFGARRRVTVRAAGKVRRPRADRRGRISVALVVTAAGRGSVASGRVRLPFRFTVPAATPQGQPSLPIRAAFYYPWFPEAWRQRGLQPFTHFHPSAGFYSAADPAQLRRQVDDMLYGNIDAGIISWHGTDSRDDARIPIALEAAHGTPFRWGVYYETEGNSDEEGGGDPDPATIRADLIHIRDKFASDPAYLRVNGRFVVFVWTDRDDGPEMAERWRQANDVGAYVVLKVFSGYRNAPAQPDAWHQYAPAKPEDFQQGQAFAVSPGFWHAQEPQPRLERSVDRFAASVRAMVASNAPWQLVTTYNEWGEGTAVESADEWASASGHGAYMDVLHSDGR